MARILLISIIHALGYTTGNCTFAFVCRLRLPLGLWGLSVATHLRHLPSSLTQIESSSASPLMDLALTKASLSTSKPEVLVCDTKGKRMFDMNFVGKTIPKYHNCSFHMLIADKVCPAVITPHSTVTPQQPEYPQGQTVTVKCKLGYVVNTVSVQNTRVFNTFYVLKPLLR